MKNIRLATIFIFVLFVFCLPVMAQQYKFDDGRDRGILRIGGGQKIYAVTGTLYVLDKYCEITGAYYPTTGQLKGWCKYDGGSKTELSGFKMNKKDAFQLNLGGTAFVLYRSVEGISGKWSVEQNGDGRSYRGTLILKQEGIKITGTAQWNNNQNGTVSGQLYENNQVAFTIYYEGGLEGYYRATLSNNSEDMVGGTAKANKGSGATVSWTAKRESTLELEKESGSIPNVLTECERYDGEICGKWTRQGNQFHAAWSNGAKATLTITQWDNGQVIITRKDTSDSVSTGFTATYTGKLSGNSIVDGKVTWSKPGREWSGTWKAYW